MTPWFLSTLLIFGLSVSARANLISNGSFEDVDVDVSVVSPPFSGIDSTTIPDWQVYNTDLDKVPAFSATIISNASKGSKAVRLDATTEAPSGTQGVGDWNAKFPVSDATVYTFSFDAAYIAGVTDKNLSVNIAQFDANENFIGQPTYVHSVFEAEYKTFVVSWTPAPGTVIAYVAFTPMGYTVGTTSLSIDNVQMDEVPKK